MSQDQAKKEIGVLVMSYGTPQSLEDVEAYYTHIRRGNPPTAEQLQELTERYSAIVGGVFPLRENTNKQVTGLEEELNSRYPKYHFTCYQGLKHAAPFIEDGIAQMVQDGITEAVGVVLAPHYSIMSVGGYIKRAEEQAEQLGLKIRFVKSYHLHPQLLEALTERIEESLALFTEEEQKNLKVLFSAHSLPEKILEMQDPYVEQLLETSRAIAQEKNLSNWQFAWQSAGQTAMPWLGPDILDVLQTIRQEEQIENVIVAPIGFVSDHLEVLYDIDIECQSMAQQLGMKLERTRSLNVDPKYMYALAQVILEQVEGE